MPVLISGTEDIAENLLAQHEIMDVVEGTLLARSDGA